MLVTNQIHGPVIINIFGPADDEGNRLVIGQASGSHWNVLRSAMTANLEQYSATPDPSNPRALWSGDEIDPETGQYRHTVFLRFDTAEDAQAAFELAGLWPTETKVQLQPQNQE